MARELVVYCDPHNNTGEKIPAEIALITIRVNDPNEVGKARIITGALDLCGEHQSAIQELESLLTTYGLKLDEKSRGLLRGAVNASGVVPETGWRLCRDCKPAKLLRKGSIPTHCSGVHERKERELDIVMCDEEGNEIPT